MALSTFSAFNYGHVITTQNRNIAFDEGAGELNAQITIGDYTLGEFVIAIQTALNAVSVTNTFTVTVDRSDRSITIVADTSAFDLLITSGATIGTGAFGLMGFTGADVTGLLTYTGNNPSGSQWKPQTILQDYLAPGDFEEFIAPSVNESASGVIETITFGVRQFTEFTVPIITDKTPQDGQVIKGDPSGVSNAREFMRGIVTKAKFEFVPDRNTPSTFFKVLLESTDVGQDGTSFRLRERVGDSLPGYFELKTTKLRVIT